MKSSGFRTLLTISIAMNVAFVLGFVVSRFVSPALTDPMPQTLYSDRQGGIFGKGPSDYESASADIARDLGLAEEQRVMLAASWQESEQRGREILEAVEEARLAWWQQMSEPEPDRRMLAELESDMTELMREFRMLRSDRFRAFIETLDGEQRERVMERIRDRAPRFDAQRAGRPPHAGQGRPARPGQEAFDPTRRPQPIDPDTGPRDRRPHPNAAGRPMQPGPAAGEWDREQMRRRMAEFFENPERGRHSDLFRRLDAEGHWMPPGRQRPGPNAEREHDRRPDADLQPRPDPRRRPDLRERNERPEDQPGPAEHRRSRPNRSLEDQQPAPSDEQPQASDTPTAPTESAEERR